MRTRFILTSLLIACVCMMCGQAPDADDITGEVVEFGVFELGPGQPGTREAHFTEHGDVFAARLGLQFGFRFRLKNVPDAAAIDLQTFVTHPPIKNKNGETTTRYALLTTIPVTNHSATSVTGYSFDRPDEMTPGVWTFTHTFRGKTLVTKSFTVRAPVATASAIGGRLIRSKKERWAA